jgi:hypothetical protein
VNFENLRTIAQIGEGNPALSENTVRWWIFNAQSNGLDAALVRLGRRVYIDVERFNAWIEAQRCSDGGQRGAA